MFRNQLLILFFIPFLALSAQAQYSPALDEAMQNSDGPWRVNVILGDEPDFAAWTEEFERLGLLPQERAKRVHRYLLDKARSSQSNLIARVKGSLDEGDLFEIKKSYWLVNMMQIRAGRNALNTLASSGQVRYMQLASEDLVIPPQPIAVGQRAKNAPGGTEPGIRVAGAPEMWKMGYTGLGRKALIFDSGIVPVHPAVKDRFLYFNEPGEYGWKGIDSDRPKDRPGNHGTHVTGTVLGLDRETKDSIGMAFNARFMSTDPILDKPPYRQMSDYVGYYQFYFNPDGDTSTYDDVPDVINNSWGLFSRDTSLCTNYAADMAEAMAAAGIAVIFSAGNDGPDSLTIGRPAYINVSPVNLFAVGAVNGNDSTLRIASFSSRGPSICPGTGSLKIKPEVVAPGVNVRSAYGTDDYDLKSGTSMASPHVTGAVLLLKEAFPFLPGYKILEALYYSAIDLGPAGEDNSYGMGIINLPAAYQYLSQQYTPVAPRKRTYDLVVEEVQIPGALFICTDTVRAEFTFSNRGDHAAINPMIYILKGKEATDSFQFTGTVMPGESRQAEALFRNIRGSSKQEYGVRVDWSEPVEEYDPIDNQRYVRFYSRVENENQVDGEYFTADSINFRSGYFLLENPDDLDTWEKVYINNDSDARVLLFDCSNYLPRQRQSDMIYSPSFTSSEGAFRFRMDYAYATKSSFFKDSLIVEYSLDCGAHFDHSVFAKAGSDLESYAPVSRDPSGADWVLFDSTFYIPEGSQIIFRIRGVNDYGGKIFIRKLGFFDPKLVGMDEISHDFRVYPNPVDDILKIENSSSKAVQFILTDVNGTPQMSGKIYPGNNSVPMGGLSPGLFILHLRNEQGLHIQKIIKAR